MKKFYAITVFVLFFFVDLSAQVWCPPGATWNFTFAGVGQVTTTYGYSELKYVGDVTVDGILCKKMYYQRFANYWVTVNPPKQPEYRNYFTYENNGIVFVRIGPNNFDTLINFNCPIGKGWSITAFAPEGCTDPPIEAQYTVTDTGHVMINAVNLKYMKIGPGDSTTAFTNSATAVLAYERMGDISSFIFRYKWGCSNQTDLWPLEGHFTCYYDNTFPVYTKSGEVCNVNLVGIKEQLDKRTGNVSPNPSNGLFTVHADYEGPFYVYSTTGDLVKTVRWTSSSTVLDLSDLPNGIYFVKSSEPHLMPLQKLLKQ